MTTEEITLLLSIAERRIAELKPEQERLWAEFKTLEAELEQASIPSKQARDNWHEVYTEIQSLTNTKARYAAELAKDGGIAA